MSTIQNTSSFTPRVALVTGAAQGIGESIALQLALEGISVGLFNLRNQETLLQDLVKKIKGFGDVKVISIIEDISIEEDMKSVIEEVVKVLGDLDIIVANAGIAPLSFIIDMTNEEWKHIQSINIDRTMYCYKHATLQMIKQRHGGHIIGTSYSLHHCYVNNKNLFSDTGASSLVGKKGLPNCCAYSTSKFAIRGLTQSAALDLQPYNITVNTYASGYIDTPLTHSRIEQIPEHLQPPMSTKPDVIAALVAFLVKPKAYYVTGQSISVNGGTHFD
ncbi:acetoin reductase family protein [Abortiporus biennis]|nr:acetoin reductase family protein [Abortiporus biennis]